jgi:putative copper export protein
MHLLVVCGWLIALVAQSAPLRDRVPRALAATAWRLDPWLLAVAVVTGGVATMLRIGDLRLMTGTTYGLMMLAKAVPAGGLVIADLVLGGARESWHRRPAVRGGVAVVALVATVVSWIVG